MTLAHHFSQPAVAKRLAVQVFRLNQAVCVEQERSRAVIEISRTGYSHPDITPKIRPLLSMLSSLPWFQRRSGGCPAAEYSALYFSVSSHK